MTDLFSISAMFILFRETLEACVIISVMLQLCMKLKLMQLRKWGRHLSVACIFWAVPRKAYAQARRTCGYLKIPTFRHSLGRICTMHVSAKTMCMLAVWLGAIGGLLLAIVIGVIFIVIFYVAQQTVFQGDGKNIFEGILLLIASFMITFLAFAMLKIRGYEEKWQAKLEASATQMVSLHPMPMPCLCAANRVLPAHICLSCNKKFPHACAASAERSLGHQFSQGFTDSWHSWATGSW
jgi:high-affinity Fe2+/Pb2+ permease